MSLAFRCVAGRGWLSITGKVSYGRVVLIRFEVRARTYGGGDALC